MEAPGRVEDDNQIGRVDLVELTGVKAMDALLDSAFGDLDLERALAQLNAPAPLFCSRILAPSLPLQRCILKQEIVRVDLGTKVSVHWTQLTHYL